MTQHGNPTIPQIHDALVDVPGGRVFTRRWSVPVARHAPLVLLHDSLGCVALWRDFPLELAMACHCDVLAYDRLGFGKSSARKEKPSLQFIHEEAATFFPALQQALNLERFSLFGHSVGGGMALAIAALHPGACAAVITESAQAFVEERTKAGIRTAMQHFARPDQFAKLVRLHGEKAAWVFAAWTDIWLSPDFAGWNLDPYLGKIACPVLAIHGDEDEYGSLAFPRRIVAQVSGNAEQFILHGCGHIPHREQKMQVLRVCSAFLNSHILSL